MTSKSRMRWLLALPFALMLAIWSASGAQADGPLTFVGKVPLNAKAHGLALQNNLAYVATEKGLTILNIANPGPPLSIGTVGVLQPKLPAFPSTLLKSQAVAVEGDYAYLVGAYLIVVDISDPALPDPVGKLAIPGGGMDVVVKDNVIYAISFAGELYVICAAAPRPAGCPAGASEVTPKIARVIGLPAWANAGADLVNLKRLCPPDGIPPCDQPAMTSGNGRGTGVSLAGDRLFAVEWAYGRLYHFEITNPLHPKFVSTHYAQYLIKAYADLDQDVVYMLTAFGSVSGLRSVPISVLDNFVSSRYNDPNTCPCRRCAATSSRTSPSIWATSPSPATSMSSTPAAKAPANSTSSTPFRRCRTRPLTPTVSASTAWEWRTGWRYAHRAITSSRRPASWAFRSTSS